MKNIRMNSRTINYLMLALIVVMVIVSLVGANEVVGLLGKQANTLVGLKAKRQALASQQTNLLVEKQEIKKYSSIEQIAQTVVPQNKDQAEAVREINNFATTNGIKLSGISFPQSSLGTSASAPAAPVTPTPAQSAATSTISLSQLTPVTGIPGVYTLQINVEENGVYNTTSYSSFFNFLKDIENNRLTSQVTGVTIQPAGGNAINFTITINEYIKPQ